LTLLRSPHNADGRPVLRTACSAMRARGGRLRERPEGLGVLVLEDVGCDRADRHDGVLGLPERALRGTRELDGDNELAGLAVAEHDRRDLDEPARVRDGLRRTLCRDGETGAHAAGEGDDARLVRADLQAHLAADADRLELREDLDRRARRAAVDDDPLGGDRSAGEHDRAAGGPPAGRAGRGAAVGQQRADEVLEDVVG
jgi:hypothetical protein